MNYLKEWAEKARVGGKVVINGVEYAIEEIIAYHCDAEKWVNIVAHDAAGRELAVEAVEGEDELTLWQQIPTIDYRNACVAQIELNGEHYKLAEQGTAKATVKTADGTEEANVPYYVHATASGRRIAIEQWDNKTYCYIAEAAEPKVSFP